MTMQIEVTEAELKQITQAVDAYPSGEAAKEALVAVTMGMLLNLPTEIMKEQKKLVLKHQDENAAAYAPLLAKLRGVAQQPFEFAVKA